MIKISNIPQKWSITVRQHPTKSTSVGIPQGIPSHSTHILGIPNLEGKPLRMGTKGIRLSDRQLKALRPREKDYVLTDGNGLQLRVCSNGSLLWNFNYRHPISKKRINMGLGAYPDLPLAKARSSTLAARELLALGIDPVSR
ncbi:MAG: Arm DNA-binding domain-containing protein [Porticoccaceae bacterium]